MPNGEDLSTFPTNVDLSTPSAARVYDYYLGGACNLKVDRDFAKKIVETVPEVRDAARLNRAFLRRVVRYCAERGVRQFLDVGAGIPTVGHTHEIARRVDPSCRVVYVDHEPVAVAHSELLLSEDENAAIVEADLRDPDTIFNAPVTRRLLDLSEPVLVLMLTVLHFVSADDDPDAILRRYRDRLVPGSFLAISHASMDGMAGERVDRGAKLYSGTTNPVTLRNRAQVGALFTGFELVEPGVVFTPNWHPETPEDAEDPERSLALGGLGQKII